MHRWIFVAILALLTTPVLANTVIKVAAQEGDEKFFPLLAYIYKSIGYEATFTVLPSARALAATNAGQYDAEVGRIPQIAAQYADIVYTAEPLIKVQLVGLVKRGSQLRIQSKDELKKLRVGALNGMAVSDYYIKKESINAHTVRSHDQLAGMLNQKRLDVVLMGTAFRDSPVFEAGDVALTLEDFNVYHLFNKRHAELAARFDAKLREAKRDGHYAKLLAR